MTELNTQGKEIKVGFFFTEFVLFGFFCELDRMWKKYSPPHQVFRQLS